MAPRYFECDVEYAPYGYVGEPARRKIVLREEFAQLYMGLTLHIDGVIVDARVLSVGAEQAPWKLGDPGPS
jgi:hypothetical protein